MNKEPLLCFAVAVALAALSPAGCGKVGAKADLTAQIEAANTALDRVVKTVPEHDADNMAMALRTLSRTMEALRAAVRKADPSATGRLERAQKAVESYEQVRSLLLAGRYRDDDMLARLADLRRQIDALAQS